jgi:MSHA biogenesis protein MshP
MMPGRASAKTKQSLRAQHGFALVSGIFLITILFLLSAYMIGFRAHQDSSLVLDALGTRAFAAARSGAEWGAYESLRNGNCAGSTTVALAGTLSAFTATVACSRSVYDEGGATINIDTIVANACNQAAGGKCPNNAPGLNYVERQITVTVGQ